MLHHLPTTSSYDDDLHGFLTVSFLEMFDALPFHYSEAAIHVERPLPYFARLPCQWHVEHSTDLRSRALTFDRSNDCGAPRAKDWLGPSIKKTWLWWTNVFWIYSASGRNTIVGFLILIPTAGHTLECCFGIVTLFCVVFVLLYIFLGKKIFMYIIRNNPFLRA